MLNLAMLAVGSVLAAGTEHADPFCHAALIFEPGPDTPRHVHASCIVECPNGDLRAVWYENGPELPPPYYTGDADKSADVRIGGARKPHAGAAWEPPFVMADTFGVSDNNPCMVVDAQQRLWLVHATLITVPERAWGSSLVQFHVSNDYALPGPPNWFRESFLAVHPHGFEQALMARFDARAEERDYTGDQREKALERVRERLGDVFKRRLGWMPRAHPFVRSDGAVLVPLANENYGIAAMAITKDAGRTWQISQAVPETGLIQPTLVEFPDGGMAAFFRNGHPARRIVRSDSTDGGLTWGPIEVTSLPHPGSGIEAVLLNSGRLAMIYNDKEEDPRDRLAVSLSEDAGKTWPYTRHLENTPGRRFDYPSLIQAADGTLHATYTVDTKTIKYAHFSEAWVIEGD